MRNYSVMATVAPKADLRQTQDSQWYYGGDFVGAVSAVMQSLANFKDDDLMMTLGVSITVTDPGIIIPVTSPDVVIEPDPEADPDTEAGAGAGADHTHDEA